MILVKLFIVGIFLAIVDGSQFIKYYIYNNLSIATQFKSMLQVKQSVLVSKHSPTNKCMSACNSEPSCKIATLDQANNCTLFNNQTTLINTVPTTGTYLFSRIELQMCFSGFYANLTALVCRVQKPIASFCVSSNECLNSVGLQCVSGSCQCPPDTE